MLPADLCLSKTEYSYGLFFLFDGKKEEENIAGKNLCCIGINLWRPLFA
jgi:hypothetical protein